MLKPPRKNLLEIGTVDALTDLIAEAPLGVNAQFCRDAVLVSYVHDQQPHLDWVERLRSVHKNVTTVAAPPPIPYENLLQ